MRISLPKRSTNRGNVLMNKVIVGVVIVAGLTATFTVTAQIQKDRFNACLGQAMGHAFTAGSVISLPVAHHGVTAHGQRPGLPLCGSHIDGQVPPVLGANGIETAQESDGTGLLWKWVK